MTPLEEQPLAKAFDGRNRPKGLIVTPGASADREHSTLRAIDDGLPEVTVRRLTLATTSVPRAVEKIRTAGAELAQELGCAPHRIAYGGRSFGGRACSVAVAEGLPAAGLVLLSYPLHPPGKPEKLRVEHFAMVDVPTLFLSGDKDPFGTPAEFAQHVPSVEGPTTVAWVPGPHAPKDDALVVSIVRKWLGL